MEKLTPQQYMQDRWEKQKDYYSKNSRSSKRLYHIFQVVIAVGAIAVPILLGINEIPKLIPTILSGLVAAATAWENIFKYGDNWRNYRQTLEGMRRERFLFEAGAGDYLDLSPEKSFALFVARTEALIAVETSRYFPERKEGEKTNLTV